jgi:methylenetetrahydrofolate reductase (NADPH)
MNPVYVMMNTHATFNLLMRIAMPTPHVSFEFFPPNTPEATDRLWQCIQKLAPLNPEFVSVTYGAGGSTRERTHDTVARILNETPLAPAAHLTCVGSSPDDVQEILERYKAMGVKHLVALRGDIPKDQTPEQALKHYRYATDLIKHINEVGGFTCSVAGYPEAHPESPNHYLDIGYLKLKADMGATDVMTQFFFEADTFLRFRDNCVMAGIEIPIIPGILPITNLKQTLSFSERCGASVSERIIALFEGLDEDPETRNLIATNEAIRLCERLQSEGVERFHFYTLNRSDLTYGICHALGIRSSQPSVTTKM